MNLFALLLLAIPAADDKPAPKPVFPLGKDTTVVTGPLDPNGFIDYEAALNDRLGKGITPDKNANALIWQALGPRPQGGTGMPAAFFKRLGIKEPPEKGDYLVSSNHFIRDHLRLDASDYEAFFAQQRRATQRAWTAKALPHIAAWVKANEKPLDVFVAASKRPEYFNPLVSRRSDKEPGSNLLGVILPGAQSCRDAGALLAARALLRAGEGKLDDAWQDLLACHRLGRLMTRGATLIEAMVGIAIDQMACNATVAYLEWADLTPRQIEERLKELRALPPAAPVADKVALGERFMFLDSVKTIRRGGVGALEGLAGGAAPKKPTAEAEKALAMLDWGLILRNGNHWFDRLAAAMRLKARADRHREFGKIEDDLIALKAKAGEPGSLAKLLLKGPDRAVSEAIGNVLISLMMPAVSRMQAIEDRIEQAHRNLEVAFALAAYRRDNGRYPAKLDDLAPKYLKAVPGDVFTGKPLIYRPAAKGYVFYSVGMNGKDDGGTLLTDDPAGDDVGVRMPLRVKE